MVKPAGIIAAIGNFDGVHLGHQHLLHAAAALAAQEGAGLGVVLFDPHPRRYFKPDEAPFLLTSPAQRDAILKSLGADKIFALKFDKALASLTPEAFVKDILAGELGLRGVVTGADFRFGARRAGDVQLLKSIGCEAGLKVEAAALLSGDEETGKFGSSGVRKALRQGDVKGAASMLGRNWSVLGKVVEGQKLGRTIGFATANFTLGDIVEPRKGVYATRVNVDGAAMNAVSNFGRRPTVGSAAPLLETHIFDFDGDLYGKTIEVAFVDFIRDEQKFDGLEALKKQIKVDCETAKSMLSSL